MNEDRRQFSDQLLQCESTDETLRQKSEKEIRAMFEKQLGPVGRAVWWFWAVFCAAQAALFAGVAVWSYGDLPLWGTVTFGLGIVFTLTFAGICVQIAASGRLKLMVQPPALAGLGWVFIVLVVTIYMVIAPDSIAGLRMILCGLVFLVGAAVFLLASRTEQAELRTKEKLLEIEYQVAELTERLSQGS